MRHRHATVAGLATVLSSAFIDISGSRPSSRSRQRQPDCQPHQEKTNRQQHTIAEPFNVFTADHRSSRRYSLWIMVSGCNDLLIAV